MTAVSRFRLFRRSDPPPPYPSPGFGPAPGRAAPAGWGAPPVPPVVGPPVHRPVPWTPPVVDPPTDPHGFLPVPPPAPRAGPALPDTAEAAALAGAFAADYLSWDEDDPERRGRVLAGYLPDPGSDPARLGWSGTGRQRADFALPGRVRPDGEGRVLVDVRVRVTPYRPVGEHGPDRGVADDPEPGGEPATAPAPTSRGWRGLPAHWIRISVPVAAERGRLVVDAWEETLGEESSTASPAAADDHALADDEPLVAVPDPGSGW